MKTKLALYILAALGVFIYAAAVARNTVHIMEAPAHELLRSRIEPNPVRPVDGLLHITIITESIRREQCPVEIYRIFANALGEIVYQTYLIGGRVRATGQVAEFPFSMTLPAAKFPPGDYTYSGWALNQCQGGPLIVPAKHSQFTVAP
jgi:hypothetical protein